MFSNCFISIYSRFFGEPVIKIVLFKVKLFLKDLDQNLGTLEGLKAPSAGTVTGRGPLFVPLILS